MNKLVERHPTREGTPHLPDTHETLPELPPGITVPDDISGLAMPTTERRRAASGVRWMRWLVAAIVVMAGAVGLALVLRSDDTGTPVLDGYAKAELNRVAVLQDLTTPVLDGYAKAELNRVAVLQDLTTPVLDGYAKAELNRVAVLQDLSS